MKRFKFIYNDGWTRYIFASSIQTALYYALRKDMRDDDYPWGEISQITLWDSNTIFRVGDEATI